MMIPNTDSMPASDIPVAMWLVQAGLDNVPPERLVTDFCTSTLEAGIPLQRVFIGTATLHPLMRAHGYIWQAGNGLIASEDMPHRDPDDEPPPWQASPLRHMLANDVAEMRRNLTGPEANFDFPVLTEFAEQGLTDWFALAHDFGWDFDKTLTVTDRYAGIGMISSFTTTHAGGFSEDHLTRLRRLVRLLALSMKSSVLTRLSRDVAAAYLGGDAASRVLSGAIRRGMAQKIDAAILYADLRGFTALADRLAIEPLIATLNAYFDCLGPAIERHGGQVLKFLGDGLLASFQLQAGQDAMPICRAVLAAADEAHAAVAELNAAREQAGQPVLALDIALHRGEVMYGNVGTGARLDFTLIGPAVNEAARLENLCAALDRSLVVSASFAKAAGEGQGLTSLGFHPLRGLPEPQEVYGRVCDAQAPVGTT